MHENPRFLKISAFRFDGVSPVTATWSPTPATRNNASSFLQQEIVGRFAFTDFFRPGVLGGVMRFRSISEPDPNARLEIRSASAVEVPGQPIIFDQLLKVVPITREWSEPVLLGPTDAVCPFLLPNGQLGATAAMEFVIAELQGDNYTELAAAAVTAAALLLAAGVVPVSSIDVIGPIAIPPPAGDLVVFIDTDAGIDIGLPPIASVPLGRKVTFIRRAADSAAGPPRIVPNLPTDAVNGRTGVETYYYALRVGDSITYSRVPGGWSHNRGVSTTNRIVSNAAIVPVPAQQDGVIFVVAQGPAGTVINLGPVAASARSVLVVVQNDTQLPQQINAAPGEFINGNGYRFLWPGGVCYLYNNGISWQAVGGTNQVFLQVLPAATVLQPWVDDPLLVETTAPVAAAYTLPPTANVRLGATAWFNNTSAALHTIAAAAGQTINGAASINIAAGQIRQVVSVGLGAWWAI